MKSPLLLLALLLLAARPAHAEQGFVLGVEQDDGKEEKSLPLDEYAHVPKGLLALPAGAQKDETPAPAPAETLPQALGQIPGVFQVPLAEGDRPREEADNSGPLTFEQVMAYYRAGKFDVAIKSLTPLAESHNPDAQQLLGVMYLNGQGAQKSVQKAAHYFVLASEAGKPLAEHYLANINIQGLGMEVPDTISGLMWLHMAILHYPDGPERERAKADRDALYTRMTRTEKNRALDLARDRLDRRGEAHLLDLQN